MTTAEVLQLFTVIFAAGTLFYLIGKDINSNKKK